MKGKRLIVTLVFVFALMLALAISSYASTITLYSGADDTSSATTHNGSLTLTGNTEENETVTVYFTDDGRAWKAGETVFFTEDTNLYTIECTKISSVSEFNNATGGGNYILMSDIDNTQSGSGPLNGDNCTTRIFMNGKTFAIGNQDSSMLQGNSQSFYILGEGHISSTYGGPLYRGHCNNANADVTWLIGKDITIETNKDSGNVFLVWNTISVKSLSVHIYGTIIKAQSGVVGVWNLLSADNISTDYDIYFHEGSSIELTGYIVRYGASTAPTDTKIGEIICDGADITLVYSNYFFYDKSSSAYNGTITINAGTFNIANATSLAEFKACIVSDKMALDIDTTSFRVICKECAFEKTLGDDFVGLTSDFTINSYCPNCKTTGESTAVSKVFEAKGYSLNPASTAINGGYIVNHTSLALYEEIMGNISYGIVIANANSFGNNSFFDESNAVNSESAIQVPIENKYSFFNFTIAGFGASTSTLELIITAYVIDEDGTVTYIQSVNDYALEVTIGTETFTKVTLDRVKANTSTTSTDAIVPSNDEE